MRQNVWNQKDIKVWNQDVSEEISSTSTLIKEDIKNSETYAQENNK